MINRHNQKDLYSVKQRYATRKLKKGMASVLIGFTMLFGSGVLGQSNIPKAYGEEDACLAPGEYEKAKQVYDEYKQKVDQAEKEGFVGYLNREKEKNPSNEYEIVDNAEFSNDKVEIASKKDGTGYLLYFKKEYPNIANLIPTQESSYMEYGNINESKLEKDMKTTQRNNAIESALNKRVSTKDYKK